MISIEKETQNYIEISCSDIAPDTIDKISNILDDLGIVDVDGIRDYEIYIWSHVVNDSDGGYRFFDREVGDLNYDWTEAILNALDKAHGLKDFEVTGKFLFRKPDPVQSVVDNVNSNLLALKDKINEV